MRINQYIDTLNKRHKSGISREHSYRGDFENLFRDLIKGVEITNEPANVTDCGNPDYVITTNKIPIGYIEAKDIGKDLNSKSYKEQFERYKQALDNLIITDYIWFQFFQNGVLVNEIRIAEIDDGIIKSITNNFVKFENLLSNFASFKGQTIKSSKKLAVMMAAKARLLQNTLENAVTSDEQTTANSSLRGQLESFKKMLIHDITPKAFADLYAQTLAYGMFAARLNDPTLEDFSRQEAAELIPKSNPFLRKLFQYIAGYDIDPRIKITVENLADVFRATDVKSLLSDFGKSTEQNDPIIHFYETFLAEYDAKLRKQRGVWYTPEPVVKFIVRSVDYILKTEFDIKDGLADTSKTKIKVKAMTKATTDRRSKMKEVEVEKEIHKVQILDPATGTGTFLAEVVKFIYNKGFKAMQGIWSSYVENDLIPRLNGFELLMASYTMAHLKLEMLLAETGYKPSKEQRFNIYLTNSLEPGVKEVPNLFMAQWLTDESAKANEVKQEKPVMVVLGNPPYAVSSSNKGEWIQNLLKDYKRNLNERKINIDDDYVKFIRYGQHLIDKTGEGILAYISNNSFIEGITFREMRKQLLESFDKIYILDLHGSAKKAEKSLDGTKDENVFDIMQGVSINVFIKKKSTKNKLAKVYHSDLYGSRQFKYEKLNKNSIGSIKFTGLKYQEPYFFFVPKDFGLETQYKSGFILTELFVAKSSGIETKCDAISVHFNKDELEKNLKLFNELSIPDLKLAFPKRKESSGWNFNDAKGDIVSGNYKHHRLYYRPFDTRYSIITENSGGFIGRSRYDIMRHFIDENKNLGLQVCRQQSTFDFQHILVTNTAVDRNSISLQTRESTYLFPLYLYTDNKGQLSTRKEVQTKPNLKKEIVQEIAKKLNLNFTDQKSQTNGTFSPIDILDYIYGVLHSPLYREKYKEFFKIDFPRVPYPKDKKTFWKIVGIGSLIRQIHLFESPKVENYITSYPKDGNNTITTKIGKKDWELFDKKNELGRIWINDEQYFDKIPLNVWETYIGGFQPAQKWLKDRKERTLNFEDILHYQKIIVALNETNRLMKEIDKIEIE